MAEAQGSGSSAKMTKTWEVAVEPGEEAALARHLLTLTTSPGSRTLDSSVPSQPESKGESNLSLSVEFLSDIHPPSRKTPVFGTSVNSETRSRAYSPYHLSSSRQVVAQLSSRGHDTYTTDDQFFDRRVARQWSVSRGAQEEPNPPLMRAL